MKIGIYGGGFDPFNNGHLALANELVDRLGLDKIILVPSAAPRRAYGAPFNERMKMIELATAKNKKIEVSDAERRLQVKLKRLVVYYYELAEYLKKKIYPRDELYFLFGADILDRVPDTFINFEEFIKTNIMVVANRQGYEIDRKKAAKYPNIRILDNVKGFEVDSDDVRKRVREKKSIEKLVPPEVRKYIEQNKLYQNPETTGVIGLPGYNVPPYFPIIEVICDVLGMKMELPNYVSKKDKQKYLAVFDPTTIGVMYTNEKFCLHRNMILHNYHEMKGEVDALILPKMVTEKLVPCPTTNMLPEELKAVSPVPFFVPKYYPENSGENEKEVAQLARALGAGDKQLKEILKGVTKYLAPVQGSVQEKPPQLLPVDAPRTLVIIAGAIEKTALNFVQKHYGVSIKDLRDYCKENGIEIKRPNAEYYYPLKPIMYELKKIEEKKLAQGVILARDPHCRSKEGLDAILREKSPLPLLVLEMTNTDCIYAMKKGELRGQNETKLVAFIEMLQDT